MSQQQGRSRYAGWALSTTKRAFVLVVAMALLAAIVTVQMMPREASADEVQEPQEQAVANPTGVEGVEDVATHSDGSDPSESTIIDPTSELNAPELQSPDAGGRLPREYEEALANWPEDEASDFREYYLEHPEELAMIEVERLIRDDWAVDHNNFSVRAGTAASTTSPAPVQCGTKVALILDASSSIDANEMKQVKNAANTVVDNFAGSATELAIFNFGSESPTAGSVPLAGAEMAPRRMLTAEDVELAKSRIGKLTAAYVSDNPLQGGPTGRDTNWKAALERVLGENYDSVLFVTDGWPNMPDVNGNPQGGFLYEGLEAAQKTAGKVKAEGTRITSLYIGSNDPGTVTTKFCYNASRNSGECAHLTPQGTQVETIPYISGTDLIPGLSVEQVRMFGNNATKSTDLNQSKRNPTLTAADTVACSGKRWTYGGVGFRSLLNCPINGSNSYYAASRVTGRPLDVLKTVSDETLRIDDFEGLKRELNKLTDVCRGTVTLKKTVVDEAGTDIPGEALNGWTFKASKSIDKKNGADYIADDKEYVTDSGGYAVFQIASSEALNVGAGGVTVSEKPRSGYQVRKQGGKTATCRFFGAGGSAPSTAVYDDLTGDSNSFRISGVARGDRVVCLIQNMVARDPEVSLKKRVGFDGQYSDANDKESALDLGRSRDDLSVEFEIENTGPVALGYLELSDRQLDVEGDKPLDLSGLRCGTGNSLTFRGDTAKTVEIRPATPIAPGQKITCRKDGGNAFRVRDLGFREDGTAAGGYKYFGNEGKVVAKVEASSTGSAEASDPAWAKVELPPDFSIHKSVEGGENPAPVIVEGRPGDRFEAVYQVTVENNSVTTAKPDSIIETPSAVNGVSVTGVRVVNRQDSNNKLLTSDGPVSLTRNDDGSYTLDQSQFREIPGTSDGNADRSATVDVIVSYEIESSGALPGWVLDPENPDHHPNPSVYEPLTCSGEDRSRGLYNSVAFDGPNRDRQDPPAEDKSSSACVGVAVPRLELEKRIEGADADNRDEAVAIMPGASKVKISYTVVNTGMVELEEFTISDRLGELTGSGDTIEITGLVCEEEAEVGALENNSGVEVKLETPLAARALGDDASVDGDGPSTVTCSWYADNPAAMRYGDGGFHVNTATVSAQFDKKRPNIGSLSISHGDSAWAVQLKSLDGTLPKTGGSGIGLFALLSFMFFGCAVYVIRRNRGN